MNEQGTKKKGLLWRLKHARPLASYEAQRGLADAPDSAVEEASPYEGKVDVCLGIVKEFTGIHSHYIEACRALDVPYKVLDISGPDWMEVIRRSECQAFLVWPSGELSAWKQMFDERLRIVSHELGKTVFPSYDELWFYDSKRRMHYWLAANDIPRPRTWVYYDRHEALAFGDATPLPIVCRAEVGSGVRGIQMFCERGKLLRWIKTCFKEERGNRGDNLCDRQQGSVQFQEYLPSVTEWRMIRIGASYMGYQKVKEVDSASGPTQFNCVCPSEALLAFVRHVTCRGGCESIAVDIFETVDGRYLVNELQTSFGLHVDDGLPVKEGKPGRFLFDDATRTWRFEEGLFCQNKLCNLRVMTLLAQLNNPPIGHNTPAESDRSDEV